MREIRRFAGRVVSAAVARTAGHWYASITVGAPDRSLRSAENQGAVGGDLGVSALATLSIGRMVTAP